jgi:hypothetical protein
MKVSLFSTVAIALLALTMDIASSIASAQQAATIWVPCKYPHGWTSTDASRDVNGTPPGYDHLCAVQYQPPGIVLLPCIDREVFDSINWDRVFFGQSIRVEYRCPTR